MAGTKRSDQTESELRKKHKKTRPQNFAVCIPSTVICKGNSKSLRQMTQVCYELAKALTLYNVSEVVILDVPEEQSAQNKETQDGIVQQGNKIKFNFDDNTANRGSSNLKSSVQKPSEKSLILAVLLQYFITPPYLVKATFQRNTKYLKYVKDYPTLTTIPFLKTNYLDKNEDAGRFREGLTIAEKSETPKHVPGTKVKKTKKAKRDRLNTTKYVNVGLDKPIELEKEKLPVNVRVTIDLENKKVVSPFEAYYSDFVGAKLSIGYHVRVCQEFSSLFTECAFPEGYSDTVYVEAGTYFDNAKKEEPVGKVVPEYEPANGADAASKEKKTKDNNILMVVGKKADYIRSFKKDKVSEQVSDINEFFNSQVKVAPMTRIEDAVLIALTKISV